MKQLWKKLGGLLIAAVMILAMAVPAMAADTDTDTKETAKLTITGLTAGDTVKLYQIGTSDANGELTLIKDKDQNPVFKNLEQPTSREITEVANQIQAKAISPAPTLADDQTVSGTTYTYTANAAGVYLALITSAGDKVYNPILLAANLTEDGLKGGSVDAGSSYQYGESAVAKSSQPDVNKDEDTVRKDKNDKGDTIQTGSVGERVQYSVKPILPNYPANAVNQTVYLADTMDEGLTFEYDTLKVKWNEKELTADASGAFKDGDIVIANAQKADNGFRMSFVYNNLKNIGPVVTYSAVINDRAKIGSEGNKNNVRYYYASNPTNGSTYDKLETEPEEGENIKRRTDQEIVYTYEIKFRKIDDGTNPKGLAGAVYGLYEDDKCTKLVDRIETNKKGDGASSKVGAGTYYLKELVPPKGYSLSETVTQVEARWATVKATTTASTERNTYTSKKPNDDAVQVGWLKDSVFYAIDVFDTTTAEKAGAVAAYLSSNTKTEDQVTFTEKNTAGSGVVIAPDIKDTKLGELPSTGGIGTYLFTLIGVAACAAAIGLILAARKRKTLQK